MSKASINTKQQSSPATPNASAWSRGPPTAASNTSSNVPSAVSTPPPPNGASSNEPATGSSPVAIGAAFKRGSLMVGGNGDVPPRGNLAFGTVDSPNPLLSSSPAAPATTGSHLADAVKSFGSIDAETTAAGTAAIIRPPRRTSGGANPTSPSGLPQKKLDVHSLFAGKPPSANAASPLSPQQSPQTIGSPQDRRQSIGQSFGANGLPASAPHPYAQNAGQPPHLRPPQGQGPPRSPVMGVAQQQFAGQVPQGQFRVPPQAQMQGSQAQVRPPSGPMGVPRPMMGQQGMPYMPPGQAPGYGMMYNYYGYDQHYMQGQQWAPPPNMPLSPRSAQAQLGQSQAPPAPGSASGSMPTPPSRPQSLVGGQPSSPMPTTPSRPMQPGSPFTPTLTPTSAPPTPGLSAGAMAFTPRAKSTIKIARPDGTRVDLSEVVSAVKVPSAPSSGVATPEVAEEAPKKKVPTLPVIVRMESEEQRKTRLAEEQKKKKIQEEEAREEEERKARQERRAKEEEERKAKEAEEKEKEEAKPEEIKPEEAKPAAATPEPTPEIKAPETPVIKEPETPKIEEPEVKADVSPAPITPSSAAASPLQSPALAAAGLPAKPLTAINGAAAASRRPTPAALDVKMATASVSQPSAGTSALASAKPIDDLGTIEYPATVKPLRTELYAGSPGKFRYDRDFLMQFMEVCKDKPETLPPLGEIGLEADSSSNFASSSRPRGGARISSSGGMSRSGMGTPARGGGFAGGMGNFNMPSRVGSMTSEQRMRMGMGSRQGSFVPAMDRTRSGPGRSHSGAGKRRPPHASTINDPDVAPLTVSANAWVNARSAPTDEKSPAYIERKVKALLNKLTEEKFESISAQILEWANKSREETDGMTLKLVIKLVFEKSTDESHWSAMYAKLCRLLLDRLDPAVSEVIDGKTVSGGSLFRKYLLGRCQADFEAGWKAREEAALAANAKSEEDKERLAKAEAAKDTDDGPAMLSDEYYLAQKAKRRGLGLVQLIGELYKLEMLSKGVIRECLVRLLGNVENPDEEDLESTCKLLTTVGKQFEAPVQGKADTSRPLDVVFERLTAISDNDNVSSRIRFMLMDVIDLRRNRWNSKKEVVPTTIAQIHQQAARENAEKAQAARESISRGGSRAGHSRRDAGGNSQPGEWQSVNAGPRPPQRPTDLSNFGRGVSSAGLPNTPTFGPTGAFARGNRRTPAGTTPPLSRHASTTNMSNMFGVLNEAGDSAAEAPAEPAPERKKLQLAPRTKPVSGDAEGEEEGSEEEEEESSSMTEVEAKAKIAMDMKELWGEKDAGGSRSPGDIVEYYQALPAEHRHLLSEQLAEDVFRIAKLRDAEVVAKGWQAALKDEAATTEDLSKGLSARMPSLDDDAIDFPQAYKAVAVLMRALSLGQEEIDALVEKIEVYGEPRITPKMKLDKALGQVDEEAAAASE